MVQSPRKNWLPTVISTAVSALLLGGCGYHLVNQNTQERVFIEAFRNETLQPALEVAIEDALRRRILSTPGYRPAPDPDHADIVISAVIKQFNRDVLFLSPADPTDIAAARWTIAADITVRRAQHIAYVGRIAENATENLSPGYREEDLTAQIADRLARKIIFLLRTDHASPGL